MRYLASAALAFLAAFPAWGQDAWPYTCLPAVDADAVHTARGDELVAHKDQGAKVLFLWARAEGGFFIVEVNRMTLEACIIDETQYDPRDSVSG